MSDKVTQSVSGIQFAQPTYGNLQLRGNYRTQTGPNTQVTANDLSTSLMNMYTNDLNQFGHNTALKNMQTYANEITGGKYTPNLDNGKVSFTDSFGNAVNGNSVLAGNDGMSWNGLNLTQDIFNGLGAGMNLANSALATWSNFANYGTQKELLNENLKSARLRNEQLVEDMKDIKSERERRDRMRSNAQSQRASSSSVRSF